MESRSWRACLKFERQGLLLTSPGYRDNSPVTVPSDGVSEVGQMRVRPRSPQELSEHHHHPHLGE
jgi:hypothetical protein